MASQHTKLSSKACPFRPSIGALSTSSSLTASPGSINRIPTSSTLPNTSSSYPNLTDLDSSTGSVATTLSMPSSGLTPLAPPGQFQAAPGWFPYMAFVAVPADPQGDFCIGDFRSKLLKHAQMTANTQTSQAPFKINEAPFKMNEGSMGEFRLMQALISDGVHHTTSPTGRSSELRAGDRRLAMGKCMQPSEASGDVDSSTRSIDMRKFAPPLQHASTFNEGMGSSHAVSKEASKAPATDASKEALPVRNTFIHFTEACDGPLEPPNHHDQWSSAPEILITKEWNTKYPAMEVAHTRGDCRPCVYFTKKNDGCRWGEGCEFCHLCPTGSLQRKRKEKVKEIRMKETREYQEKNRRAVHQQPAV